MGLSDYLGRFWYSSEPMFGVIMVVCFTCILRYNQTPALMHLFLDDIIIAALSCCIAWGLVDGIFYAWEAHYEQEKKKKLISLAASPDGGERARSLIEQNLDETLVGELDNEEKERIYKKVLEKLPKTEAGKVPLKDDAITVFLAFALVVGSAVLVLVPFFFVLDEKSPSVILDALLVSNILGILLLFFMGYWREEEPRITKKIWTGSMTALIAVIITGFTIVLGG